MQIFIPGGIVDLLLRCVPALAIISAFYIWQINRRLDVKDEIRSKLHHCLYSIHQIIYSKNLLVNGKLTTKNISSSQGKIECGSSICSQLDVKHFAILGSEMRLHLSDLYVLIIVKKHLLSKKDHDTGMSAHNMLAEVFNDLSLSDFLLEDNDDAHPRWPSQETIEKSEKIIKKVTATSEEFLTSRW